MVRLLLSHGVGVDNCYANGLTPLWTAVFYNHEDTVRVLVENGADIEGHCYLPNLRSLDYAIVYGFYEIALFLY